VTKKSARADIPSPLKLFEGPLKIPHESAVVIGDLHCPHHNPLMIERVVRTAYKHKIRSLIIAGDLFDFAKLSRHTHDQIEASLDETLLIGGDVLGYLMKAFTELILLPGNHDQWLSRKLDAPFDFGLIVDAALRGRKGKTSLLVTNHDYVLLGDKWLIGHPSNYSAQGGKTPSELADIYGKNVVTGHNHVIGLASSKSGKYMGIDCGHMSNQEYHFYADRRLSKTPRWCAGFVVIDRGYPTLYTENWSDWD
jgi:DNA repair exonuclease SbcCD nuclease subunit